MANQATRYAGVIDIGPWGGQDGKTVDFIPGTTSWRISKIDIGHDKDGVNFLYVESKDRNTQAIQKEKWGTGVANDSVPDLEYGYLTSIRGTTRINQKGQCVVQSLTFRVGNGDNWKGPYGPNTDGSAFEIPLENGEVVGFSVNAGDGINGILTHVIPQHS